jgi:DNA-binding MarR family transcriptional regulator
MTSDATPRVPAEAVLSFSRLLEPFGLPPIAGRIYGCLLLEGAELSLEALAAGTGSSKASVSQNARLLEREGWIERVPQLRDRKDYYALGPRGGTQPVELLIEQLRAFGSAYKDICDRGHARNAQSRNHLRLCASLFEHMASSVAGQLSEWKSRVRG